MGMMINVSLLFVAYEHKNVPWTDRQTHTQFYFYKLCLPFCIVLPATVNTSNFFHEIDGVFAFSLLPYVCLAYM